MATKEVQNSTTGLTSIQEEAVNMLVAGDSIQTIAQKLELNETTISKWQETITFKCYYNKKCKDIKANINDSLLALYEKALATLTSCMDSENESVRLKTATWLLEKVSTFTFGSGNPVEVIRKQCIETDNVWGDSPTLNQSKFKKMLLENGLEE